MLNSFLTPFDIYPEQEFKSYESYVSYVFKLPAPVRSVLMSVKTADFINSQIGQLNHLTAEQIIVVTSIVRDVLIANLFIGDMSNAIRDEANIDAEVSRKIADSIVGQLFAPAINEIKDLQRKNFADRLSGSQSPQQQTQSSQTINLRQQPAAQQPQRPQPLRPSPAPQPQPEPKPAPPMDPIIASLKQQGAQPRPVSPPTPPQQPPRPSQNPLPQGQFPTTGPGQNQQSQPQRQPQNVFKVPNINFDEPQTKSEPKQINNPNVLDLREQEKQ